MPDYRDLTADGGEHPPEAARATLGEGRTADEFEGSPAVTGDPADEKREPALAYCVTAIGWSAGGLDPCVELFRKLPATTGMAFVLVPRLPADEQGNVAEVLCRHTRMPVHQVDEALVPRPNHVYVAGPDRRLSITGGLLTTEPVPADGSGAIVIDRLFRSLAMDQRHRAVGVLLSGCDSDGALGLNAIKGEGGIAIVPDLASAEHDTLPRSTIADHADLVLSPADIANELARLAPQICRPDIEKLEHGLLSPADEPQFARIVDLLRGVSGIDFRLYRPATLQRRTARRMILCGMGSLSQYANYVHANGDELRSLHEDVLIGVTRFFRDTEVFEALKSNLLPEILKARPAEKQVRIWVPGCSTGEEVYSIGMCLLEVLSTQAVEPAIQIIGTDASEKSIERARTGVYPETIAEDVSAERLRRFFVKMDAGYQISKRLRDLCIFARQNLCDDPPFSRLDLISCRNLLIYLGPEIQQRIITTFHYALRPKGYLLLGDAESIRAHADLFAPVDPNNRFYIRADQPSRIVHDPETRPSLRETGAPEARSVTRAARADLDLQRAADRVLLARYTPAGVVINEHMEVLQVRGRIAPYLEVASGSASLHVLRMAREEHGPPLRDAIRRAIAEEVPVVVEDLSICDGGEIHSFKVDVLPIRGVPGRARGFLIVFVPQPPAVTLDAVTYPADPHEQEEVTKEVARLHHDLSSTRLYLQSLIEERDHRNQELTSAYEELQSANEELQTVNEELRNRNAALLHASNDLVNLLNSVNIPIVMLGSDLRIRQFTPPAERLLKIRHADVGRSIMEIRLNIQVDDLEVLLQNVIDTLRTKEMEVQDRDDRWYLMRVRPYRTTDNRIDGVVLVLLEMDHIRRAEQAMREACDFLQVIVNTVPVPFVVLGRELKVCSANEAFAFLSGLHLDEIRDRSFPDLANRLWHIQGICTALQNTYDQGDAASPFQAEYEVTGENDRVLRMSAHSVTVGSERWLLVLMEDVTAVRKAEHLLESTRDELAGDVPNMLETLARTRQELRALNARLFTSQEEERRRVARELHDDISQKLAALELDTEHLRQQFPNHPAEVQAALAGLRQRMSALSNDVRDLSHALHPAMLDDLGLAAALKRLTEDFGTRESMLVSFTRRSLPRRIPRAVAAAMYRIAQEALRNVSKHAGQAHVKVSLEGLRGNGVRLTVRDSGDGFDVTQRSVQRGLGLIGMQERARLMGGSITINSELGEGTTVTVTAPITKEDASE